VIVSAVRTPIGKLMGSFKNIPAHELGAAVIKHALSEASVDKCEVSEVIFGQGLQGNCGQNPARQASIAAGLSNEVPAITINQVCGSGLRSIAMGYQAIKCGDDSVVVCGGQENMSLAPHCADLRSGTILGGVQFNDSLMHDGLTDAFSGCKMGVTAENIAQKWNISRKDQDDFSHNSHVKATNAWKSGHFTGEVVPIQLPRPRRGEKTELSEDECYRSNSTVERFASQKPYFTEGRDVEQCTVTAGNSCPINDGAAALVLADANLAKQRNMRPLAKVVSWAQVGVDPQFMGIGPVPAIKAALEKAAWSLDDVDLFEVNEAFASQSLAVVRELNLDMDKVNVNGGSIAVGHPIGASGARIVVTLLHEMKRRNVKRGCAAICVGGGMGLALCVEALVTCSC